MKNNKFYTVLALAGTLPFVACALLPLFGVSTVPVLGPLDAVASSYGLAIVCFVAGSHWGVDLSVKGKPPLNLFISSNVIFLFVWFAYIGVNLKLAIAAQLVAFLALLFIDHRLLASDLISGHYFRIRLTATLIAVGSLLIILLT